MTPMTTARPTIVRTIELPPAPTCSAPWARAVADVQRRALAVRRERARQEEEARRKGGRGRADEGRRELHSPRKGTLDRSQPARSRHAHGRVLSGGRSGSLEAQLVDDRAGQQDDRERVEPDERDEDEDERRADPDARRSSGRAGTRSPRCPSRSWRRARRARRSATGSPPRHPPVDEAQAARSSDQDAAASVTPYTSPRTSESPNGRSWAVWREQRCPAASAPPPCRR